MSEIYLNPNQAKSLSELIRNVKAPLPDAYADLADTLSDLSDDEDGEILIIVQPDEEED